MTSAVVSYTAGPRVALVTGAATRIGAATARALHQQGYAVGIHYRSSEAPAARLCDELNTKREGSAALFKADLGCWGVSGPAAAVSSRPTCVSSSPSPYSSPSSPSSYSSISSSSSLPDVCAALVEGVVSVFGDLHVLVNNASSFTKTPLLLSDDEVFNEKKEDDENDDGERSASLCNEEEGVFVSNALAPFYLTKAFARYVQKRQRETDAKKNDHSISISKADGVQTEKAEESLGRDGAAAHEAEAEAEAAYSDRSIIFFGDALVSRCPHRTYGLYSMAKAGAENMTQTASTELAPIGVRVNCVRPGFNVFPEGMPEVDRDRLRSLVPTNPVRIKAEGRVGGMAGKDEGAPDDMAKTICFLVDAERAGYISGAMVDVDGGLRHVGMS